MAQTLIVKLTDDIDGGDADETVAFSLDGKSYEIDLSERNASVLRKAFAPYIEKARSAARAAGGRGQARSTASEGTKTLFSQLDAEEKERFRRWAKMPNARRIGDGRVQAWIDAGRP